MLKEGAGLSNGLLCTLAVIAGVSVANLYYNQPLLDMLRQDLGTTTLAANHVALFSQLGYALGLLFIIPLADLFSRRRIVLVNFLLLAVSLLAIATASDIRVIHGFSLVTGVCSVIPQIFIPLAAQYSRPEYKNRNVGIVLSGLLTGILASRVVSGVVGEPFRLARNVFRRRRTHGRFGGRRAVCTARCAPQLPGNLCRPDEVAPYDRPALSDAAALFRARRAGFRLLFVFLGFARLQDGAGAVLCRQQRRRHARPLRNRGRSDGDLRREVHPARRRAQVQLYRRRPADPRMAAVLLRCGFLCGARRRNRRCRYRHAVHPGSAIRPLCSNSIPRLRTGSTRFL